jgi:hypothetical protein
VVQALLRRRKEGFRAARYRCGGRGGCGHGGAGARSGLVVGIM